MQTFSDGKKVWSLRWTVGVIREARSVWYYRTDTKHRLNPSMPEEWIGNLFADAELLADLIWLAAIKQHPGASKDEIDDALYGQVIEAAREALIDEIVNFSQDRTGRGKMLKAIAEEVKAKMAEIIEQATDSLTLSESVTSGAENSELMEVS